jgi:hypothetical protein
MARPARSGVPTSGRSDSATETRWFGQIDDIVVSQWCVRPVRTFPLSGMSCVRTTSYALMRSVATRSSVSSSTR